MIMRIELDDRLKMLAALTPACSVAADVGADHGFLGAWLLANGRCERVQFLDISALSLQKARKLVEHMELTERSVFSVGDGMEALKEPAQTVIIAGMGGATIAGIIERGRDRLNGSRVIMQPNVGSCELRKSLMKMGFTIVDEALAQVGRRWYVGIAAEAGQSMYSDIELLAGPILLKRKPPLLTGYVEFKIRVLEKAYAGALRGSKEQMTKALGKELIQWKEIMQCL